jgi:carboxylesterase
MTIPQIIPSTEPFFFPGNQIGCLLIHGFTGTPKEVRLMGEYLNQQGFTILGIRLSGHATQPADMIRTTYNDWLTSVEDGFQLLSGVTQNIYAIGHSTGGSLSYTAASYLPIKGIVSMSSPYKLPDDWRLNYTEIIAKVMPYLPKHKGPPGAGWVDREAWKDHISYPHNPVRSIGQLNKLLEKMRGLLPQVKTPALLMHSREDRYVLPENMTGIYNDLGSTDKQMLWIENSGHALPRDAQRETVFHAAADFIRQIESKTHAP